jgi:acetyltransferase-like isoleucine patch superfamily enzyme
MRRLQEMRDRSPSLRNMHDQIPTFVYKLFGEKYPLVRAAAELDVPNNKNWLGMVSGGIYDGTDPIFVKMRERIIPILHKFNQAVKDTTGPEAEALFCQTLYNVIIRRPFQTNYGLNTHLGKDVFINMDCTILDCAPVTIGDGTFIAPKVGIYTASHPIEAMPRSKWIELAKPVEIGKQCWICAGVTIRPGVKIGDRAVIGAGSVVTKDIPPDVLAYGNPCKVIKLIGNGLENEDLARYVRLIKGNGDVYPNNIIPFSC